MSSQPSNATLQAAAEWFSILRADQATPQERQRWQAWLEASEEHHTAWRYVQDLGQTFSVLREAPDPAVATDKLLQANQRLHHRRQVLACIAGAVGAGVLGMLTWPRTSRLVLAWSADYHTATGEQRQIVLTDGTHIWMNTSTALNVDFTASLRRIALAAGEVFVETGKDPARPFVVDTNQGRMRALGTRFNVRQQGDETLLAVYEGRVEVTPRDDGVPLVVQANQQVRFTRDRITQPTAADPAREAWIAGLLIAHDVPLREVVRELSRYRHGHIGVDEAIANLRVYGSFPLGDTDRALVMLTTVLPVQVRQSLPWWMNIEARPS
ncbi:FecR family protein [Paraburkholderia tropica]|uniref:FecR family protein n=1 Tax=Paraburkholderia tropica TaxID=92647 RepID=UPI002AB794FD|nr:FecR family protein [Paraburkholderia tropica]